MGRQVVRPKASHWKSDGTPKTEYTQEEAHTKALELLDEDMGNGKLMTFPVSYKCSECAWWHVGNANPRGPWSK